MKQNYPLSTCLNPTVIYNPTLKQDISVPCGHCKACLMRKASTLTRMCELESLTHSRTYFITLTFANEYIPKAQLVLNGNPDMSYDLVDIESGELIRENIYVDDETISTLHRKLGTEYIPYLSVYLLQKFFKRLRKYYGKEKMRYFACGEYGPKHFRPHYHILLWFEDEKKFYPTLPLYISKAWPFGRTDVQIAKDKASRYVAGYANSFSFVPSLLKISEIRPFTVHSQRIGFDFVKESSKEVYKSSYDDIVKKGYVINGCYKEFDLWRSAKAFYFPRCIGYSAKTSLQRIESYRLYHYVPKFCTNISQATQLVYDCLYEPYNVTSDTEHLYIYFKMQFGDTVFIDDEKIQESIKRRIYTELSISKHFIECSQSIDIKWYYNIPYQSKDVEVILLQLIEKFYQIQDYRMFTESLSRLESYTAEHTEENEILTYYYSIQYEEQNIQNLEANKRYIQSVEKRFEDSVKHKKLNDLNNILFNKKSDYYG